MRRRDWITTAAGAIPVLLTAQAVDRDNPPTEANGLSAYREGGKVVVRWKNRPLTTYRANIDQRFPYFFPLAGPVTGAPLTSESAMPYPHHRSLWFACDKVNGVDYWHDKPLADGQILSRRLEIDEASADRIVISNDCRWVHPTADSPFEDRRRFTLTAIDDRRWTIESEFTLTAATAVEIAKTNHSLFAVRCSPDLAPVYGGTLVNSNGKTREKATNGDPAKWCSFYGRRAGGAVEGITLMDHPKNPWAPCEWFTRDYGFLSPTPLNYIKEPVQLAKGESLKLRYLVVCHAGDPAAAEIDGLYARWIGG
jgi:methane monooxygenase PmoA-like